MLEKILNLEGAKELTKKEQKTINGGKENCINPATNTCYYYRISCAPPCQLEP